MAGIVKILDLNGLSYLYTKLRNEIDDFQAESKTIIDAAAASANAAADNANSIVAGANDKYLAKTDAASLYSTKQELLDAIGGVTSISYSVVSSLPSTGADGVIYLVPKTGAESDNSYYEYIWVKSTSKFEKIGDTKVDLSDYLKSADAANAYLSKTDASSTYLTKTAAGNTYLAKTDASNTYLTKSDASNTYLGKTANAASATKLATARTIAISGAVSGSASFDGTGNITINTTVQAGTAAPSSLANGSIYCVYE